MELTVSSSRSIFNAGEIVHIQLTFHIANNSEAANLYQIIHSLDIQLLGICILDNKYYNWNNLTQLQQYKLSSQSFAILQSVPTRFTLNSTVHQHRKQLILDYSIDLPSTLPPSYNGFALKYDYQLIISLAKHETLFQEIKFPIKIICSNPDINQTNRSTPFNLQPKGNLVETNSENALNYMNHIQNGQMNGFEEKSALPSGSIVPTPRFTDKKSFGDNSEDDLIELQALLNDTTDYSQLLNTATTQLSQLSAVDNDSEEFDADFEALSSANNQTYKISKVIQSKINNETKETDASVVQLTLDKNYYNLGDIIKVQLNFANSSVAVYKILIHLEQIETIPQQFTYKTANTTVASAEFSRILATKHVFSSQIQAETIEIQLPIENLPNVSMDFYSLSYQLRFSFITDRNIKGNYAFQNKTQQQIQAELNAEHSNTELLHWSLPIRVGVYKVHQYTAIYQAVAQQSMLKQFQIKAA
jgi:hypothetical protein